MDHHPTAFEKDHQLIPVEEPEPDHFTRLSSLNEHQHRWIFLQAIGRVMAFIMEGRTIEERGRNATVLNWLLDPSTLDRLGQELSMSRQAATTRARRMEGKVNEVIRAARRESEEFSSQTNNQ